MYQALVRQTFMMTKWTHCKGIEMEFKKLQRKFKVGVTLLDDPLPNGTLEQVHELLSMQHPLIRHTHIFESDGRLSDCKTHMLYTIVLPPVKVNG